MIHARPRHATALAALIFLAAPAPAIAAPDVRVATDKVRYEPGETATVAAHWPGHASDVRVELITGLGEPVSLEGSLESAADGNTWRATFDTSNLQWGGEVRAMRAGADEPVARSYFTIHDNFWAPAILAPYPPDQPKWDTKAGAAAVAQELRDRGYTAFELFFWAPCDLTDFTPDTERFFGSQGAYPATITGTRNMVEAAHAIGISATVYANLWGGGGPPGFEMMRKHPEWFGAANFQVDVLDDWDLLGPNHDMTGAHVRAPGIEWTYNNARLGYPDGLLEHHASELAASSKMFGFDGVRYDSHYSRYWTVKAVDRVKHLVRQQVPEFGFGFNTFPLREAEALALPVQVSDGGMIMGEGVRIERVRHFRRWAMQMLEWRRMVWAYGGQFGMISRESREPLADAWQGAIILAGGAHPYYGALPSEPVDLPRFALRYGEFIFDNAMARPREAKAIFKIDGPTDYFIPDQFVMTRSLGAGRQRIVMHLLNVPEDYRFDTSFEKSPDKPDVKMVEDPLLGELGDATGDLMDDPEPSTPSTKVTFHLPAEVSDVRAWELHGEPTPMHRSLDVVGLSDQPAVTVATPEVWKTIVLEYTGPALPTPPTHRDFTDSAITAWRLLGPFENDRELTALDTAYPPEQGVDLGATVETLLGPTTWLDFRQWQKGSDIRVPHPRLLDFHAIYPETRGDPIVVYAFTTLHTEQPRTVHLHLKADEAAKVFLNGEQVFRKVMGEFTSSPPAKIELSLNAGRNELLIKVAEKWGWNTMIAWLTDAAGEPVGDAVTVGEGVE